jgi:hypothetical protein
MRVAVNQAEGMSLSYCDMNGKEFAHFQDGTSKMPSRLYTEHMVSIDDGLQGDRHVSRIPDKYNRHVASHFGDRFHTQGVYTLSCALSMCRHSNCDASDLNILFVLALVAVCEPVSCPHAAQHSFSIQLHVWISQPLIALFQVLRQTILSLSPVKEPSLMLWAFLYGTLLSCLLLAGTWQDCLLSSDASSRKSESRTLYLGISPRFRTLHRRIHVTWAYLYGSERLVSCLDQ